MRHHYTISFCTVLILLVLQNALYGQNYVDVLKLNAHTSSDNKFDSSASTTKVNEYHADLLVPIKMSERFSILTGVTHESIQTKLYSDAEPTYFSGTALKLGFSSKLNDKWVTTIIALPKISSDHGYSDRHDAQFGAIALFKYLKKDNFNYKFGLYYNSELFGPFFVPMAGLYFLSENKKVEVNMMLPLQFNFNYTLNHFVDLGLNYNGQIRSYHLKSSVPNATDTYIARATNELCAYLKFSFTKNISLQTRFGQSLGRSYRVYAENDRVNVAMPTLYFGGHRKQLNRDFADGMVMQVILLYRVHLEKK